MELVDSGAIETDALLEKLEKQIAQQYTTAENEMQQKLDRYLKRYEAMNAKKLAQVEAGTLTVEQYETWKQNRAYDRKWYESMVDTLSRDAALTDRKAMSLVNGYTPDAYAINHNFSAFQLEQGTNMDVSFTLYSRETVEKLMREDTSLLHVFQPDYTGDVKWHKRKFNDAVMQGVLQGESIPKIKKRLQQVTGMDKNAAVRNARTAMTSAQNSGRMDTYREAEDLGIEVWKEWMATLDGRTRHSHRQLDGERRKPDEAFSNQCQYPADPKGAGSEIYNCRCTLIPFLPKYPPAEITHKGTRMNGMTYEEWKNAKAPKKQEKKQEEVTLACIESMKSSGISTLEVKKREEEISRDKIIQMVSGGDKTEGSCASLTLAYAGNLAGYEVLDFRDGESRVWFSSKMNKRKMYEEIGVPYVRATKKTNKAGCKELLKTMEEGKEYILEAGRHASVVRYHDEEYEYLELQSSWRPNGWKHLGFNLKECETMLQWRFGDMNESYAEYYRPILIDVDDLVNNKEFPRILEYINTEKDKQHKGAGGSEK